MAGKLGCHFGRWRKRLQDALEGQRELRVDSYSRTRPPIDPGDNPQGWRPWRFPKRSRPFRLALGRISAPSSLMT
jgi:hypothetical protein